MSSLSSSENISSSTSHGDKCVPSSYNRSMVRLNVSDASKAIDWYTNVLKAKERKRFFSADKKNILHAEIQLGDSVIMINDVHTPNEFEAPHNASIYFYVPDVDNTYSFALKNGAIGKMSPHEAVYGERIAGFKDPFGNFWTISTKDEKPKTQEEIKSAIEKAAKSSTEENKMPTDSGRGSGMMMTGGNLQGKDEIGKWKKMNYIHFNKPENRKPRQIVPESEWLSTLQRHSLIEKDLTHHKDYVLSLRQQLPWTEFRSDYIFECLDGKKVNFFDLFINSEHDDLIIYHMMLPDSLEDNRCCPMCAGIVDAFNGTQFLLKQKTNIAEVAKGSTTIISNFARSRGWTLPIYSTHNNTFNEDLGASLTNQQYNQFKQLIDNEGGDTKKALLKLKEINPNHPNVKYNFGLGMPHLIINFPMLNVFHLDRKDKKNYRTFHAAARGLENGFAAMGFLDFLSYGREGFHPKHLQTNA